MTAETQNENFLEPLKLKTIYYMRILCTYLHIYSHTKLCTYVCTHVKHVHKWLYITLYVRTCNTTNLHVNICSGTVMTLYNIWIV